jgi:hypothetical protein
MTDAPLPPDAADELVSAYLDGEADAAERARVEADPDLQARVEVLARVRAAVQSPVPVDPARREAALTAALDAATRPGGVLAGGTERTVVALAPRRWSVPSPRWRYLAVAAAVAVAALAVPLLSQLGDSDDEADRASVALDDQAETFGSAGGEALDATEREEAAPTADDAAGGAASSPAFAAGELGAFDDLDGLAGAARKRVDASTAPTTTTGATGAEGVTSTTLAGPCAGQLDLPADTEVLLDATATLGGEPVVVVVHRAPGADPQLVVARLDGCLRVVDQPL